MRPVLLFAALASGGCYPYIAGGKDANVPPEEALVLGAYSYTDAVGDYWEEFFGIDDPSSGSAYFGVFDEPKAVHPWNTVALRTDLCESDQPEPDWFDDFDDVGDGSATLVSGSVDIDLDWNGVLYATDLNGSDWAPSSVFDLEGAEIDGETYDIEGFVKNPSAMTWTSPDLDTDEPPTLDDSDLTFTWTAPQADVIGIVVRLYDAEFQLTEVAYCLTENTGSFTIPTDHWDDFGDARWGLVDIGQYNEAFGPLDFADPGVGYRVTGEEWFIGAFEVQ